MDAIWLGPAGYIPGLGFHDAGERLSIADETWALALEREGKIKIVKAKAAEPPRTQKPSKQIGGE